MERVITSRPLLQCINVLHDLGYISGPIRREAISCYEQRQYSSIFRILGRQGFKFRALHRNVSIKKGHFAVLKTEDIHLSKPKAAYKSIW